MRKYVLLIVLGVVAVSPALAKDPKKATVYGAGNASCGTWTDARKYPDSTAAYGYLGWIQGFMSATELLSPADFRSTDAQGINAYMDKYCAERPLETIVSGAMELLGELREKKSQ